jgi:hypothetical protein
VSPRLCGPCSGLTKKVIGIDVEVEAMERRTSDEEIHSAL